MIQLSSVFWIIIALFCVIGFIRGWTREVIATAAIILALFTTWQFRVAILQPLTQGARPEQVFYLYAALLIVITFFGYQTPEAAKRMSEGRLWGERREGLQERLLGLLIGGVNGYLVFGTLWSYMEFTDYPLKPFITRPVAGSPSAAMISALPLNFLVENNLLTILVIVLFLFVIVALI